MSYKVKVNRNSVEFNPLVNLIDKVGKQYDTNTKEKLCKMIKIDYGITIGEYTEDYNFIDFGNERNYILFLLEWT